MQCCQKLNVSRGILVEGSSVFPVMGATQTEAMAEAMAYDGVTAQPQCQIKQSFPPSPLDRCPRRRRIAVWLDSVCTIVGWQLSHTTHTELVLDALEMLSTSAG